MYATTQLGLDDDLHYDASEFVGSDQPDADDADVLEDPDPGPTISQSGVVAPEVGPIWTALSSEQAEADMLALTVWVDWLVRRFELVTTIRPCWQHHGYAIEILTALRERWVEAYLTPVPDRLLQPGAKRGREMLGWLTELRNHSPTLGNAFSKCQVAHHDPLVELGVLSKPGLWVTHTVDIDIAQADLRGHPLPSPTG